ncbi:MAG: helix-turn-helix transcriptional regulator [Clostridia bacterium]|nr:helix-turn-helix transcriptional regulator [Clostridia bacterium]
MNTNDVVAKRILQLLNERHLSQYKLEQKSCVYHGAMNRILTSKNKGITLATVYKIARGFNMTIDEFFDDDIFRSEDIDVE